MDGSNDMTLLWEYLDRNSETAFAELVNRHINLIYSVALRYTGNSHDAQDVTQAVFVILARKAPTLRQRTNLTGWLYETTRFTCGLVLRTRFRQKAREQEAYLQATLNDPENGTQWRQLAPLLEEAMSRLSEKDRTLVALRFFENRSLAETAAALGIREWAARKRAQRAMEKLQKFFLKRGIASSTSVLAGVISVNSVQAAPTALAKSVTAVAIAKGAAVSGPSLTLIKGALKIMAWTKAKTAIVIGAGLLLTAGTATITVKEIAAHRHLVWQDKFDLTVLEKVPPQVTILPSLPTTLQSALHTAGTRNNKALALGQSVQDIIGRAYAIRPARIIPDVPLPDGKYDFIANLPQGAEANEEGLRQEIKKKFGLIGRREQIETNVLVLMVQSKDAAGCGAVLANLPVYKRIILFRLTIKPSGHSLTISSEV